MSLLQDKISKIKALLGTESGAAWIVFMDYIYTELSEVLGKQGKPTKQAIESSLIGQAGFKSWKDMVETEEKKGGLGWNYASFDSWKRAYKMVLAHPFLRELEITASQINTLNRESKKFNTPFPSSLDEYSGITEQRADKQKELHQNSLKDANNRNYELEVKLTAQLLELDRLRLIEQQNAVLMKEKAVLNQKIGEMKQKLTGLMKIIDDRDSKIKKLSNQDLVIQKLKRENKKYLDMTFVQKFFFLFK